MGVREALGEADEPLRPPVLDLLIFSFSLLNNNSGYALPPVAQDSRWDTGDCVLVEYCRDLVLFLIYERF